MIGDGVEVGTRFETRGAMKRRYAQERATECRDCGPARTCDCTYECTDCGATRVGAPNHPEGKCPDAAH